MVPPLAAPPKRLVVDEIPVLQAAVNERATHPQRGGLRLAQPRIGKIAVTGTTGREQQVSAHLPVAVCQTVRVTRPGRIQQQATGFHRLAGHHVDARRHPPGCVGGIEILDR